MDLFMSEDRGVTYLTLIGQLWEREDVRKVQDKLAELFAAKTSRVVLNLERLTFIGSIGLGGLMRMYSDARKNGCTFMVYRPLGNVKEAFELAEFPSIMPVLETQLGLDAALNPPVVPS
jgi:anti-anti-sigma factor